MTEPVWFRTVGLSVDQVRREERKPTAIEERQLPTGKRSGNWTRRDPPLTAGATHSDWCHGKRGVLKSSLKPRPFLFGGVVRGARTLKWSLLLAKSSRVGLAFVGARE